MSRTIQARRRHLLKKPRRGQPRRKVGRTWLTTRASTSTTMLAWSIQILRMELTLNLKTYAAESTALSRKARQSRVTRFWNYDNKTKSRSKTSCLCKNRKTSCFKVWESAKMHQTLTITGRSYFKRQDTHNSIVRMAWLRRRSSNCRLQWSRPTSRRTITTW